MDCRREIIAKSCPCSWMVCSRKGKCCECIAYHKKLGELPACLFSESAERTYDRSFEKFAEDKGLYCKIYRKQKDKI